MGHDRGCDRYLFFSPLSLSSTSSALQVALESLSPWEPCFTPCSLLEVLAELFVSSPTRARLVSVESLAAATGACIGCICCSLPGSPASVFTSCLMVALSGSPGTGGFSSTEPWSEPDAASFSPLLPAEPLAPPSPSLGLLSSEERGDGRLSVSELLLAPPGGREGGREVAIRSH